MNPIWYTCGVQYRCTTIPQSDRYGECGEVLRTRYADVYDTFRLMIASPLPHLDQFGRHLPRIIRWYHHTDTAILATLRVVYRRVAQPCRMIRLLKILCPLL